MSERLHVLIIEDSALDAKVLAGLLRAGGYEVFSERVETAEQYITALNTTDWDIILADYNLPEFNGPEGLRLLQESGQDIPFIVISGGIGEDLAVQIMKSGAHDYLMKGNLARLVPAVEREVREAKVDEGPATTRKEAPPVPAAQLPPRAGGGAGGGASGQGGRWPGRAPRRHGRRPARAPPRRCPRAPWPPRGRGPRRAGVPPSRRATVRPARSRCWE